jgi:Fe-S cluster assembly iron-binding protein IscA
MKKQDREALVALLPDLLNAVFLQGRSAQRVEDAQIDFQHDTEQAQLKINEVLAVINKPEKKEIN